MMFVMEPQVTVAQLESFSHEFEQQGFSVLVSQGTERTVVGLIGATARLQVNDIVETHPFVSYGKRITEPFKLSNRAFHPDDSEIKVSDLVFSRDYFRVIAGPCSVESEEQIVHTAKVAKAAGASLLRGGAFKPRSSPYAFQGLCAEGLRLLQLAKAETGLPIVSEMTGVAQLELFEAVDVIQVGARNMQNYDLLKELGRLRKPILLKRGIHNTIEELLMSAEYILAGGNTEIILCERGIRTIETQTRSTLDISAIPVLRKLTHLPVIVDPSHAAGKSSLVAPLAKAAVAVGADGLMIEIHPEPSKALCDAAQALDLEQYVALMQDLEQRVVFEGRRLL